MIDKSTVELLVDRPVGLQVSLALYPTNEVEEKVKDERKLEQLNDLQTEIDKEEDKPHTDMEMEKDDKTEVNTAQEVSDDDNENTDTHLTNDKETTTEHAPKEESSVENSDEIDIKQEFNYFQSELQKAEDEISKPLLTQIEGDNEGQDHNNADPDFQKQETKDEDKETSTTMSKTEIQDKINWCNYQIRRILDCFKTGENLNDGLLSSLYLNHNPSKMEPISQDEIQKVIKEALTMDSDDGGGDNDDEDEFKEEDYYYDSDEGEFIKKGKKSVINDRFPVVPSSRDQIGLGFEKNNVTVKSNNTVTTGGASNDDKPGPSSIPEKNSTPNPTATATARSRSIPEVPTVADLIAKKSSIANATNPNPVHVSKPMDLETLEKQMENSELLNSASKCCKFAISSINYEDVDTALNELQEAVKLLELYKGKTEEN
ncbi:unnamed protein product [Ambrosiozyma monospora]|uniref:Unnamed protein product n=1 Tax=Ambrosiozyma monospora TaxID=43982 RepID=A0ACB5SVD6_AMBMO|nr:unnamed protein product [Ambrosiozyma monospora]